MLMGVGWARAMGEGLGATQNLPPPPSAHAISCLHPDLLESNRHSLTRVI